MSFVVVFVVLFVSLFATSRGDRNPFWDGGCRILKPLWSVSNAYTRYPVGICWFEDKHHILPAFLEHGVHSAHGTAVVEEEKGRTRKRKEVSICDHLVWHQTFAKVFTNVSNLTPPHEPVPSHSTGKKAKPERLCSMSGLTRRVRVGVPPTLLLQGAGDASTDSASEPFLSATVSPKLIPEGTRGVQNTLSISRTKQSTKHICVILSQPNWQALKSTPGWWFAECHSFILPFIALSGRRAMPWNLTVLFLGNLFQEVY